MTCLGSSYSSTCIACLVIRLAPRLYWASQRQSSVTFKVHRLVFVEAWCYLTINSSLFHLCLYPLAFFFSFSFWMHNARFVIVFFGVRDDLTSNRCSHNVILDENERQY